MASIPPFWPFTQLGNHWMWERSATQRCGALCWRLRLRLVFCRPPNPFQKLRSDHSLPLPRISPTSITYAESHAHWTLFGADPFWSCRLNVHLAHCYYDTIALSQENKSCLTVDNLRDRRGSDNKPRQPEAIGRSKSQLPREKNFS